MENGKTKEDWDELFEESATIVEEGVIKMLEEAEERGIPQQLVPIHLLSVAVIGMLKQGWSLTDIRERVSDHPEEKPKKEYPH